MYREVSIKRPVKETFYFFFKKGRMVFLLQWTRERKGTKIVRFSLRTCS